MVRLGLEALVNQWVHTGSALAGRKVLTLVSAMLVGASHIDHVDVLRAGATSEVLPHRVMAPSTIGTFLRSFTFGHVRQLDAVLSRALARAWQLGAGPGPGSRVVVDLDSTICEVHGKHKQGAAYGYTRKLGYHPLLATVAGTGEIVMSRMRKGSAGSGRGAARFINEVIAVLGRGHGPLDGSGRFGVARHPRPERRRRARPRPFWALQRQRRLAGLCRAGPQHRDLDPAPGRHRYSLPGGLVARCRQSGSPIPAVPHQSGEPDAPTIYLHPRIVPGLIASARSRGSPTLGIKQHVRQHPQLRLPRIKHRHVGITVQFLNSQRT